LRKHPFGLRLELTIAGRFDKIFDFKRLKHARSVENL
jgi:hypothetical protein